LPDPSASGQRSASTLRSGNRLQEAAMQGRTPQTMPAAGCGCFPARFQIKPRADESVDPIPTF